jgi:hypothetical protein
MKSKKKSGSKSGSKSSAKKKKLPTPDTRNADAELPAGSSEAPPETPVMHKDQKENQSQGEKSSAGGRRFKAQGGSCRYEKFSQMTKGTIFTLQQSSLAA